MKNVEYAKTIIRIFNEYDEEELFCKLIKTVGSVRAGYIFENTLKQWPDSKTKNGEIRLPTPGGLFLRIAKDQNFMCRCEIEWVFNKNHDAIAGVDAVHSCC